MANGPFDRTIINVRERALSSDVNQAASQMDYSMRFALQNMLAKSTGFAPGFLGSSYRVVQNSPTGMSVLVSAGLGLDSQPADVPSAIGGVVGVDDLAAVKPFVLNAPAQFVVPANASGNPRIDIIEVKVDRRAENPSSRLIFNNGSGAFDPTSVNKTLAFSHDGRLGTVATPASSTAGIGYKTGTPAGSPVAPPTTAGYTKIAEINVASGAVTITAAQIVDRRAILGFGGIVPVSHKFRVQWSGGAPVVSQVSTIATPGLTVATLAGNGTRSLANVFVLGGEIALANAVVRIAKVGSAPASNEFLETVMDPPAIQTVDLTLQTTLAGLGVTAAVGAKLATFAFVGRFQSAGTTNDTNTALEDVVWNLDAKLAY